MSLEKQARWEELFEQGKARETEELRQLTKKISEEIVRILDEKERLRKQAKTSAA